MISVANRGPPPVGHREDVSGWIGGGKRSRADAVSHLQLLAPNWYLPPHTHMLNSGPCGWTNDEKRV